MDTKKDYLNREKDKDNILKLISFANNNNQSLSFAINGLWGSGKTFFVNMVEESLLKTHFVFKYDAWENDYYDEPLIGILDSIKDELNEINKIKNTLKGVIKKSLHKMIDVVSGTIDYLVEKKTGISFKKLSKKIVNYLNECREENEVQGDFNPYDKIKTAKSVIVATLNKLSKERSIVFVVDEIDRCLPKYALNVIQRIHHISENVNGIVTVFCVDEIQLKQMISFYYGDIDTGVKGYLRKIIDFSYDLGNGTVDDSFLEVINDYKPLFSDPIEWISPKEVNETINNLLSGFEIRNSIKLIKNAMYIHKIVFGNEKYGYELLCIELVLTWAVNVYRNNVFYNFSEDLLSSRNTSKKPFISYLRYKQSDRTHIYTNNIMERSYVRIRSFRDLIVYMVLKNRNYYPDFSRNQLTLPSYLDDRINTFLGFLLKIRF